MIESTEELLNKLTQRGKGVLYWALKIGNRFWLKTLLFRPSTPVNSEGLIFFLEQIVGGIVVNVMKRSIASCLKIELVIVFEQVKKS